MSYFDTPNEVYIVIMYSKQENKNDFAHVMDMMVQSFRTGKINIELPAQVVLPMPTIIVPAVTTSVPVQADRALSSVSSSVR